MFYICDFLMKSIVYRSIFGLNFENISSLNFPVVLTTNLEYTRFATPHNLRLIYVGKSFFFFGKGQKVDWLLKQTLVMAKYELFPWTIEVKKA